MSFFGNFMFVSLCFLSCEFRFWMKMEAAGLVFATFVVANSHFPHIMIYGMWDYSFCCKDR